MLKNGQFLFIRVEHQWRDLLTFELVENPIVRDDRWFRASYTKTAQIKIPIVEWQTIPHNHRAGNLAAIISTLQNKIAKIKA